MAVIALKRQVGGLRFNVAPLLRLLERCADGELSVHYDREVDVLYVHLVPEIHSSDGVEIAPSIVAYLDEANRPISFIVMHATEQPLAFPGDWDGYDDFSREHALAEVGQLDIPNLLRLFDGAPTEFLLLRYDPRRDALDVSADLGSSEDPEMPALEQEPLFSVSHVSKQPLLD